MKKIILACAPTSGKLDLPGNPVLPEDIAKDVERTAEAGAALVHLHARDRSGHLTSDITCLREVSKRIREGTNMIIESSTGGLSSLTVEERALSLENPYAELGSLNIGSLNFEETVYINTLPAARFWIQRMKALGKKPMVEIFDSSNLAIAEKLIEENILEPPLTYNFIFNYQWGMCYSPKLLMLLVDMLPQGSLWGCIFGNSRDFSQHCEAARLGANLIRAGFEDSPSVDGKRARSNGEIFVALRNSLEKEGFSPASVGEAREILGLEK